MPVCRRNALEYFLIQPELQRNKGPVLVYRLVPCDDDVDDDDADDVIYISFSSILASAKGTTTLVGEREKSLTISSKALASR